MPRVQRQPRIPCRLRCHVLRRRRKPIEVRVTSLSEHGLAIVGAIQVDQGDELRLRVHPQRGDGAVDFTAMVWNDRPVRGLKGQERQVGLVVSRPTSGYIELFCRAEQRHHEMRENRAQPARSLPVPPRPSAPPQPACDVDGTAELDLPRPHVLGPPPKPDPDAQAPCFGVRLKQIGGPRTRTLQVTARSIAEAERLAFEGLEPRSDGTPAWELIEVVATKPKR